MKSWSQFLSPTGEDHIDALGAHDLGQLAAALLDGGVPDIELGALIATMRMRGDGCSLLAGLTWALSARVNRWPCDVRRVVPIAIGCYDGAWELPNLTPLLGLVLARFGIPVIMHGPLHAHAGLSTAVVLRSLGIMPCANSRQAARELETRRIAFVPDALLAPGLASLLALRARLGPTPVFTLAARLIGAFEPKSLVFAKTHDARELECLRATVLEQGLRALLLYSAQPDKLGRMGRPRIEYCREGECEILFEEDAPYAYSAATLPDAASASATSAWIQQAYEGNRVLPAALAAEVAACLYASGYCEDFNQAKAMAALGAAQRRVA